MTGAPIISVIMPSLNQGNYLEEAIRSVLRQDYAGKELIVIDGGSHDHSVDIIRRYSDRIKYWISEKDAGQSEAINKGLSKASGDVVTWLNSDDRYREGALFTAARWFAARPDTAIFHGRARLFGYRLFSKHIGPEQTLRSHEYLPYMRFPQPASFYAREAIGQTLDQHLHYAMDFELVVRNVLLGRKIGQTSALLADYRVHRGSKTLNEDRFLEEWTMVLLNALESLGNAGEMVAKLIALAGDPREESSRYACNVSFSEDELRQVYLEHLHLRFHHHYRKHDLQSCQKIAQLIGEEDSTFAARQGYGKYIQRLRQFPLLLKIKHKLLP